MVNSDLVDASGAVVLRKLRVTVVALAGLLGGLGVHAADAPGRKAFLPDQWPSDELEKYVGLQFGRDPATRARLRGPSSAEGRYGMIASTSEPLAIHSGLKVLQHGGSAADAAIATSLAQIALTGGAAISYAGIMTAVYFDAESGKAFSLNAAYNTVQNETDPLTIPGPGQHGGRTALVPGFMAGVEALHDRFGKLSFADNFGPAIWIAEQGVAFSPVLAVWSKQSGQILTRTPEGRRIFTDKEGNLLKEGDSFRQPELAATLRNAATQGVGYFYKGEWARRFVDAVRRDGGKMTLQDLAAYRVIWSEPTRIDYGDYEVISLGNHHQGALLTLGSLKAAEAVGIRQYGHYTKSPEALTYLVQISRMHSNLLSAKPETRAAFLPGTESVRDYQLLPSTATRIAAHLKQRMQSVAAPQSPAPQHSAGIVAIDSQGNLAVILHSINGVLWGTTGLFVDGVSIPDSASMQQRAVAAAGPGARLPETTNPLIVLKSGKPVLAAVSIGSGLHQAMLQNLVSILDFGMDPRTAVELPNTHGPYLGMVVNGQPQPEYEKEAVIEGDFPDDVIAGLRERGQPVKVLKQTGQDGYWLGVQMDPSTRRFVGAATQKLPSLVEGY